MDFIVDSGSSMSQLIAALQRNVDNSSRITPEKLKRGGGGGGGYNLKLFFSTKMMPNS